MLLGLFNKRVFFSTVEYILSMSYEVHLKCMKLKAIRFSEPNRMIADTNALWSEFDSVKSENKHTAHTHFTFDRSKSHNFHVVSVEVCKPQLCIALQVRLCHFEAFSNDKCISTGSGFLHLVFEVFAMNYFTLAVHLAVQFELPRSIQVNGHSRTLIVR